LARLGKSGASASRAWLLWRRHHNGAQTAFGDDPDRLTVPAKQGQIDR
jgi:hypothetical protein